MKNETIKIELDRETYHRLVVRAEIEKRSIIRQAEVELRLAMGLPFPPVPCRAEQDGRPDA